MQRDGSQFHIIGYHTQEYRIEGELEGPILCRAINGWLGVGYYFWVDEEFARYWGEDFKKVSTGYYDVYKAVINTENFLNAVFNEEHYYTFKSYILKSIEHFENLGKKCTLKRVHEFLSDNFWEKMGVEGIIYDDLPSNPKNKPNRKYSVVVHTEKEMQLFYYNKRIQIVSFNLNNINNFALYLEEQE